MTERPSIAREIFAATVALALVALVIYALTTVIGIALITIILASVGAQRTGTRSLRVRKPRTPHLPHPFEINVISRRHLKP